MDQRLLGDHDAHVVDVESVGGLAEHLIDDGGQRGGLEAHPGELHIHLHELHHAALVEALVGPLHAERLDLELIRLEGHIVRRRHVPDAPSGLPKHPRHLLGDGVAAPLVLAHVPRDPRQDVRHATVELPTHELRPDVARAVRDADLGRGPRATDVSSVDIRDAANAL